MVLSIIIVNFKTPDLILKCIACIQNTVRENTFEVIIVDNFSEDASEFIVRQKYPSVVWINNNYNAGFGRANNIGAAAAKGNYLLFLNSDAFVLENTIDFSLSILKKDSNIGVLGCKLLNEDGTFQKSTYYNIGKYTSVLKNNLVIDYFYKSGNKKTEAVMGAYLLIPTMLFNEVGGFDPDFFMYAEELDLCRRISNQGYEVKYIENVCAVHLNAGSSVGSSWSHKQNYLSNALLFLKAKGVWGYLMYHFLFIMTFVTNASLLWKMSKKYRSDFWQDQKNYFSNFILYFKIPFLFSKSFGNGKRILKRS